MRNSTLFTFGIMAIVIMAGFIFGAGTSTFKYAEGMSYFSTDPKACMNCHIMREQYNTWVKSSHHNNATCVQCHLPHSLIPKLIAKAENGWNHSKAFTLQNFHEPIMINKRNSNILQKNCIECHKTKVHELVTGATTDKGAVSCVHCHANVGHAANRI